EQLASACVAVGWRSPRRYFRGYFGLRLFVVDRLEGETPTDAQQIIYWVLLGVGVVAAGVGFRKETDSVVK
ncbi:MAG: hypothetical protein IID55_05735, partial [Proteobacteria bacterium]|nr:hypothetical protein [Pseudomonadota bacterium]